MNKKYKSYDIGFKQQLMQEIESGVITPAEASRVHGIASSVISKWQQKYREGSLNKGPTGREKMLEKENRELKEKLGELYMQIEVLKKIQSLKTQRPVAPTSIITSKNLGQYQNGAK
jgi:transposase-like protein